MRATVGAFSGVSVKCGATACVRSRKNRPASLSATCAVDTPCLSSGSPSEGTRHARSPAIPSGSRLVARTRTPEHARRIWFTSPAHAVTRCSQLSNKSSTVRVRRKLMSASVIASPDSCRTPSVDTTASGTSRGSSNGASSITQAPCAKLPTIRSTTCNARRVLPAPPVPVRVTSRSEASNELTSAISRSRPMNCVKCSGKLCAAVGAGGAIEGSNCTAFSASRMSLAR